MSNSGPIDLTPESSDLRSFQLAAQAQDRVCVVSAIVVDQWNRAFVQRRSPSRRLFPGCWDVVGGHVEPGESLYDALAREVDEETGWHLECLLGMIESVDWEADHADGQERVREFAFVASVSGDLGAPRLETGKFTEFRWIGVDELDLLQENRAEGDQVIFHLVKRGLESAA